MNAFGNPETLTDSLFLKKPLTALSIRRRLLHMALGSTLRARRLSQRYSQTAIARAAGISSSSLCLIEQDKRVPAEATLERIAAALGLTLVGLRRLAAQQATDPARHVG